MSLHISISRSVHCRFSRLNRSNWKCLWAVQAPNAQCRDKREGQLTLIPQDSWPLILFSVLLWNENNNILMDKAVATFISLLEGVSFKPARPGGLNSDPCVEESYSWGKHVCYHYYKLVYIVCVIVSGYTTFLTLRVVYKWKPYLYIHLQLAKLYFPHASLFSTASANSCRTSFPQSSGTHLTFLIGLGRESL